MFSSPGYSASELFCSFLCGFGEENTARRRCYNSLCLQLKKIGVVSPGLFDPYTQSVERINYVTELLTIASILS